MSEPKEVRVVDAKTGGAKGSKLARFDLIPPEALWALAEVYGYGCRKYADRNWEKGYKWGLSIAALERHLNLWKQGFTYDTIDGTKNGPKVEGEHTGAHHLMQVAWHAFALFIYQLRGLGTDDRGITPQEPKPRPVMGTDECCTSRSPALKAGGYWLCERKTGHTGKHMAWDDYERGILYDEGEWE